MGDELDGFLSGETHTFPPVPSGTVSLDLSVPAQPLPTMLGAGQGGSSEPAAGGLAGQIGQAANLGASWGGVAATALATQAEKLGVNTPESLKPMQEKAQGFLSKAQPWKTFLLPLSKPEPGKGLSRITSNLYQFQVNYSILFLIQIVLSILLDPSTLITLLIIGLVWVVFLKKNADPNWKPEIGGVPLGPTQRMIALSCVTLLVMLAAAGNTVFWQAFIFGIACAVHGAFHEVEAGPAVTDDVSQVGVSL